MLILIVKAITLGLIAGAIPGPILTATFTEVLNRGLKRAIQVVWWALLAEFAAATSIMVLFSFITIPNQYFQLISFVGSVVIFYMALGVWKIRTVAGDSGLSLNLKTILIMTFSNGLLWTFWVTVCVPFAFSLESDLAYGRFIFILLFELGWTISSLGFTSIFSLFKSSIEKSNSLPLLFKGFALLLFYFSIDMFISAFKALNEIFHFY